MPSVSVVIPNYNGRKLLEENIPSVIRAIKHSALTAEIIVADDASSDDSVRFLEKNYPQIKLVKNAENLGFSGNINSGFRVAVHDLVLALNSDVVLSEDYFEKQLPLFKDPELFGTMGSIFDPAGKLIDSAKYPLFQNGKLNSTVNYIYSQPVPAALPTLFLSGANALMDRKKLELLGGMNELFSPFYMEDVDLSVRAWRMGWACLYVHESKCFHLPSSTIGKEENKRRVSVISKSNKILFHLFHLNGLSRGLFKTDVFFKQLIQLVGRSKAQKEIFDRTGNLWPKMNEKKQQFDGVAKLSFDDAIKKILRLIPAKGKKLF